MKMNQIALSVIAAFALAACGSSGSSSKPTTGSTASTPSTNAPSTGTQTGGTTNNGGATNNGGTANNGGATNNGGAGTGGTTAGGTGTTTGGTTGTVATVSDHTAATKDIATVSASPFVGAKTVRKNNSNLELVNQNSTDVVSNSEVMGVGAPDKRLDTLVVAETKTASDKTAVVYLEDLDSYKDKSEKGVTKIANIYKADSGEVAKSTNGDNRGGDKGLTKTDTKGSVEGDAHTYHADRLNYTNNYKGKVFDESGKELFITDPTKVDPDVSHTRGGKNAEDTVAELYGHRTQVSNMDEDKKDYTKASTTNTPDADNNLPLLKARLENVQYGRVTSALDKQSLSNFKQGVDLGNDKLESYVGVYGGFGNKGTEDHYFYRGVNNTDKAELAALKAKGGKLTYEGHAVSYGLDNNYNGFGGVAGVNAPTAVATVARPEHGLVSGNHVAATLDLTSGKVDGSIFNKWWNGNTKAVQNVNLVTFNGDLADNGNISGTATNKTVTGALQDGVFVANVYGKDGAEMGGSVASNDKSASAWGAVFGAKQTKAEFPTPPAPPAPPTPSLTNSTNKTGG